jgi:hypothetical protein
MLCMYVHIERASEICINYIMHQIAFSWGVVHSSPHAALYLQIIAQEGPLFCIDILYSTLIKKENQIFLIYREIQSGAVAKSYMRKG